MRQARNLLAALLLGACLQPTAAHATPSVELRATLAPERLGRATTVGFGFQIAGPNGQAPPPLTAVDVRYPGNLGIALSDLGLATCSPVTIETLGVKACPANSLMGFGTAIAAIPVGPATNREAASVTLVRAPSQAGHLALMFYAEAIAPVSAQIVFPGLLLPTPAPFGGRINIDVPLVPSLPGAPYVAVTKLHATLGPEHITYYEHVHGKIVAYNPRGILLPNSCPRGGFPFAATFGFQDGSRANAHTIVPCPRGKNDRR